MSKFKYLLCTLALFTATTVFATETTPTTEIPVIQQTEIEGETTLADNTLNTEIPVVQPVDAEAETTLADTTSSTELPVIQPPEAEAEKTLARCPCGKDKKNETNLASDEIIKEEAVILPPVEIACCCEQGEVLPTNSPETQPVLV